MFIKILLIGIAFFLLVYIVVKIVRAGSLNTADAIAALGVIVTIIVALNVEPSAPPPTDPPPTEVPSISTTAMPTQALSSTFTPTQTSTSVPTEVTPSDTPQPIFTPTITNTPEPTEIPITPQLRAVEIRSGVTIFLDSRFGKTLFSRCQNLDSGFTVFFDVANKSGSDFLRFLGDTFSATDDTGFQYTLRGTGVEKCSTSLESVNFTLNSGRTNTIYVNFSENISFDATYLIITVEKISTHGPFKFRKDL